jgi:uncharacterized protein (TIGR02271 family)
MTMLTKEEFVKTHPDVRVGMTAYSTDGAKLGVIERIDEDNLTIERGWFFHKDFTIPYDDIEEIRDDRAIVRQRREDAEKGRMREESEFAGRTAGMGESERGRATEEAAIPVREEKLEAGKHAEESEVGLRKEARTEAEHLEVPVQKKAVSAERVPAEETTARTAGEKAAQEEEKWIPVKEEEVEVGKRPAVKEEVRGPKESRPETKPVSGEARKEEEKVEPNKPAQKK